MKFYRAVSLVMAVMMIAESSYAAWSWKSLLKIGRKQPNAPLERITPPDLQTPNGISEPLGTRPETWNTAALDDIEQAAARSQSKTPPDLVLNNSDSQFTDAMHEVKHGGVLNTKFRDSEISDLATSLAEQTNDISIVALEGSRGSGLTQVLYGFVQKILAGQVLPLFRKAYVLRATSNHKDFNADGFATRFSQAIQAVKSAQSKTNTVVVVFDDLGAFVDKSQLDNTFDTFVFALQSEARKNNVDVKVVIAGDKFAIEKLIKHNSVTKSNLRRVLVRDLSDEEQIEIIADFAAKHGSLFEDVPLYVGRDALVDILTKARRFNGELGMPKGAKVLLEKIKNTKLNLIHGGLTIESATSRILIRVRKLEARLQKANQLVEQMKAAGTNYKSTSAYHLTQSLQAQIDTLKAKETQLLSGFTTLKDKSARYRNLLEELEDTSATQVAKREALKKEKAQLEKDFSVITEEDVAFTIAVQGKANLEELLTRARELGIHEVRALLDKNIIGREYEKEKILKLWLMYNGGGFRDKNRPYGRWFFTGGPGTGKTSMIRLITRILYGDESALILYEGSQFNSAASNNVIKGAQSGYAGYGDGNDLFTRLKAKNGRATVMVDEADKAGDRVFGAGDEKDYTPLTNNFNLYLEEGRVVNNAGFEGQFSDSFTAWTANFLRELPDGLSREELSKFLTETYGLPENYLDRFPDYTDHITKGMIKSLLQDVHGLKNDFTDRFNEFLHLTPVQGDFKQQKVLQLINEIDEEYIADYASTLSISQKAVDRVIQLAEMEVSDSVRTIRNQTNQLRELLTEAFLGNRLIEGSAGQNILDGATSVTGPGVSNVTKKVGASEASTTTGSLNGINPLEGQFVEIDVDEAGEFIVKVITKNMDEQVQKAESSITP